MFESEGGPESALVPCNKGRAEFIVCIEELNATLYIQ